MLKTERNKEDIPAKPTGKSFYIPHRAVVMEGTESTNVRTVYVASAGESNNAPSLNDCLYSGPFEQNQLERYCSRSLPPLLITDYLKLAFLQIRIT